MMKFLFLLLLPSLSFAANFIPKTFSAKYEETQKSVLGKEKKILGDVDYKYPGNFRLQVQTEPKITFVTNKTHAWYYTPATNPAEQGQVTVSKSSSHPVAKFLDSVQNGIEGSKIFTTVWEGQDLHLVFTADAQKEYSLKEVVLHAKDSSKSMTSLLNFDNITLKNVSGTQTTLRFVELKEGVNFKPDHFIFEAPPKTKVIKG